MILSTEIGVTSITLEDSFSPHYEDYGHITCYLSFDVNLRLRN